MTGVPALFPGIESQIEADPERAAGFVETVLDLRKGRGFDLGKPSLASQQEGLRAALDRVNEGRKSMGLAPYNPAQWERLIQFPELGQREFETYTNPNVVLFGPREDFRKREADTKFLLRMADLAAKEKIGRAHV